MNQFAVLTPYLIPANMPGKRVNIGDGFILRGIERQIGAFDPVRVMSNRSAPGNAELARLRDAGTVILGGANQLDDRFQIWPGLRPDEVAAMSVRFVPFAIGINGVPDRNRGFSTEALATLEAIHDRTEVSSWRCPLTVAALEAALPHLKGRMLMTGCPVVYDRPLLEGTPFSDREGTVAVTVTERGDFWDRETGTLRYVARRFPRSRKILVLHQVFDEPTGFERRFGHVPGAGVFLKRRARLRVLARQLKFEIFAPETADTGLAFYRDVDLHFGSRLHAHLHFLSRAKRSFLTYVDDRMLGFAQYLGFPLCRPETFDAHLDFDFETVRSSARAAFSTMAVFLKSLDTKP